MNQKLLKPLILLTFSYLLFVVFLINFEPFSLDLLLDRKSLYYVGFLAFLASVYISLFTFIFIVECSKKTYFLASSFFILTVVSGIFLIYQNPVYSFLTSLIIGLSLFPAVIVPFRVNNKFIQIPMYFVIKKVYSYLALTVSLALALSFYWYTNINPNNPALSRFLDKALNTTSETAVSIVNTSTNQAMQKQSLQKNFEEDLKDLSEEDRMFVEQNQQLFEGLIKMAESEMQNNPQQQLNDLPVVSNQALKTIVDEVKIQLNGIIEKYQTEVVLLGSIGVFGFVRFVFFAVGLLAVPFNIFVFKLLISSGFLQKTKQQIEAERIKF